MTRSLEPAAPLDRRTLLRGLASAGFVSGLAGCAGVTEREFVATPVGLNRRAAAEFGFARADYAPLRLERSQSVVGLSVSATIENHLLVYAAPRGAARPSTLAVLSSPAARMLGRSLNPLADAGLQDLLLAEQAQELLSYLGVGNRWVEGPVQVGAAEVGLLGAPVPVVTFAGIAADGDQSTGLLVSMARRDDDDVVIAATGRRRDLEDDERERPLVGEAGIFTEAEVALELEEIGDRFPAVRTVDPALVVDGLGPDTAAEAYDEETGRALVEAYQAQVDVSPASIVVFAGPMEPGTVLTEPEEMADPASLTVPDAAGSWYVAVEEERPDLKFTHPVKYAALEIEAGGVDVVQAQHLPEIYVDGQRQLFGDDHQTIAVGDEEAPTYDMAWLHEQATKNLRTLKSPIPRASTQVPTSGDCSRNDKFALVLDGGEVDLPFYLGGDARDEMADNADKMGQWLQGRGFSVQRITQYDGNPRLSYPGKKGTIRPAKGETKDRDLKEGFLDILRSYVAFFRHCCKDRTKPVDFFMYLNTHGASGIELYDWKGKGEVDFVQYSHMYAILKDLPPCVRVTIFVDACHSARAFKNLGLLEIRAGPGVKVEDVTIISSCGDGENSASGEGNLDTSTEDFLQGAGYGAASLAKDHDNDDDKGDLVDCLISMILQYNDEQHPEVWSSADRADGVDNIGQLLRRAIYGDTLTKQEKIDNLRVELNRALKGHPLN